MIGRPIRPQGRAFDRSDGFSQGFQIRLLARGVGVATTNPARLTGPRSLDGRLCRSAIRTCLDGRADQLDTVGVDPAGKAFGYALELLEAVDRARAVFLERRADQHHPAGRVGEALLEPVRPPPERPGMSCGTTIPPSQAAGRRPVHPVSR